MKRTFLSALLLCGCAMPHRSTLSTRESWTYQGRADGLVRVEKWRDKDGGGCVSFFMDPSTQSLCVWHTNQSDLGGGSFFMMGMTDIKIDPQTGAIVGALGNAAGNVIGAAAHKAVGLP